MRRYELILLLPPDLNEKQRKQAIKDLTKWIVNGGVVVETEEWGKRSLKYPIRGYEEADYLFLLVNLDPSSIKPLREKMSLAEDSILRFMFIKKADVVETDAKTKKKTSKRTTKRIKEEKV